MCGLHFCFITALLYILPPKRKYEGQKHLLKYTLVYSLDCGDATGKPTQFLQQMNDLKGKTRTATDQERQKTSVREQGKKEGKKKLKVSLHVRDFNALS